MNTGIACFLSFVVARGKKYKVMKVNGRLLGVGGGMKGKGKRGGE
jgi:hypothetical protein